MSWKRLASNAFRSLRIALASMALFQFSLGTSLAAAAPPPPPSSSKDAATTTPIQHLIVIIGENRSFDHVFATYLPKNGQMVWNLLSEQIIKADGTPGLNFSKYEQTAATDQAPDTFLLSPPKSPFPDNGAASPVLPAPLVGGPNVSYVPNLCPAPTPENECVPSASETLFAGGISG